ncbi:MULTISPECIES: homoserine dehydrogenase [unclassified Sedimentibacter]|uniref:homoserine dehydrogenase n=1 Tax=unclassified Sedimentibacter TaxID=2649220 RepID=UPI0027DF0615|nr:homoserine dehydrogenase [Sedimentibacter sp. MB35-C1]WMJ76350.1 homoserine dehydrogenase [Sedimentibacter sp. MB35-C1]
MGKCYISLAILGFGNVGQAFARLLLEKHEEIFERYGFNIKVAAISTGSRGSLLNSNGINLKRALKDMSELGRFNKENTDYSVMNSMEIAKNADYDVLMELTPLKIFSGQPAIEHIASAIERKKHAISANKGPIAWAYKNLKEKALEHGVKFYYETAVMDGTPVFNLVDETLKLCKVTEVRGILNSTTNFVLEELSKGKNYDDVIMEGKKRGFVEADPSMDIEGWDAAAKTAALLNVLMDANITPLDVEREGIETITLEKIKEAEERGNVIKLVCSGKSTGGKIAAIVAPQEVPKGTLYASINGTTSVVSITTDLMGTISVVEHDPEIEQTAYGVFSDLIRVVSNCHTVSR